MLPYVLHDIESGDAHATHLRQSQVHKVGVAFLLIILFIWQGDIACYEPMTPMRHPAMSL